VGALTVEQDEVVQHIPPFPRPLEYKVVPDGQVNDVLYEAGVLHIAVLKAELYEFGLYVPVPDGHVGFTSVIHLPPPVGQ
jgi:hypothetical protein